MNREELLLSVPRKEMERLLQVEHPDPHSILGAHPLDVPGQVIIRGYHPEAVKAEVILDQGVFRPMKLVDGRGLFAVLISGRKWPFMYRLRFTFADVNTWERVDPYRFQPTLGELDLYLIGEGTHKRLYDRLGAHLLTLDGIEGTAFAIWAPNAKRVSVIGDFNHWDGRVHPMRSMGPSGVWELFVPGLEPGLLYKYELKTKKG
ncbi:MAG: 1,4-alpha-glucan branching enzyme, partial [candidate division WOR-3 bacterium]